MGRRDVVRRRECGGGSRGAHRVMARRENMAVVATMDGRRWPLAACEVGGVSWVLKFIESAWVFARWQRRNGVDGEPAASEERC